MANAATTTQSPGDKLTSAVIRPQTVSIVAAGALRPHLGPNRLLTASVNRPPRSIPTHPVRRIPVWRVPRKPISTFASLRYDGRSVTRKAHGTLMPNWSTPKYHIVLSPPTSFSIRPNEAGGLATVVADLSGVSGG